MRHFIEYFLRAAGSFECILAEIDVGGVLRINSEPSIWILPPPAFDRAYEAAGGDGDIKCIDFTEFTVIEFIGWR